ncbi:MAG TPA: hypothetical protein VH186_36300 [Chloroflexia bacterium]|nr:hypothetical protein [Chloroflexia bacterium]
MQTLAKDEMKALLEGPLDVGLSFYFSAERPGMESRQDKTSFKNLVHQAEKSLAEVGFAQPGSTALLEPVTRLLGTERSWHGVSKSLAVFSTEGFSCSYHLPFEVPDKIMVGKRFYLKPLLPFISKNTRFYILALSQNRVRLLHATQYTVHEVELPDGVPSSLAEATKYNDTEISLQFRPGLSTVSGQRPGVIRYGQGSDTDIKKENLKLFFYQVNDGLHDLLTREQVPVVLAGVSYLFQIYHQANTYPDLLQTGVEGNADDLNAQELQVKAWPLVQPIFSNLEHSSMEEFQARAGTGQTSSQLEEIIPAALHGRVKTLFVALDKDQFGYYLEDGQEVYIHLQPAAGDEDLLNLAALYTLRNGGTVFALPAQEIPGGTFAAAILRY